FETSAQKFTVSGQALQLSPREHAVLRVLIQKSGEPINKQQILDRIVTDDADINLEAIEVLVHRLRKKLAETGVQITTMRGMGYCLENAVDN
ncbi:winged helix-turn-helix domain-containing protein, partial [Cupriavidus sp. SIMBA_020]